ncbi:MAG: hypothetical protein C4335_07715 [Armatimonadota bacterium]
MDETRLVAKAKIHLVETERMPIRLPRSRPWGWPVVFTDAPEKGSFMLMVHPLEMMEACRWVSAKVAVVVREGERFLVSGSRFVFHLRDSDGLVRAVFGEGIVEQVEYVSSEAFLELFGEPWRYY